MRQMTIVAAGLLLTVTAAPDITRVESEPIHDLMQRKLQHAQKVLAGITMNDFDKIAKNAEDLIAMSKAAEWQVLKTPRYVLYSNEFQRIAETLVKNANDKNIDAATLSYVDMTLTCVKCHKYMQEKKMIRLDR